MLQKTIKNILHLLPPETAHDLTLRALGCKWVANCLTVSNSRVRPTQVLGLEFPNPIGLAAGFDKNASAVDALLRLGFGFVEVGTVTPKGQSGNPKPRLFRIQQANAIINRMGFNNAGLTALLHRLRGRRVAGIVGVNIGKNKVTPLADAHHDYLTCLEAVYEAADYVTVNISSPNTPELRQLQTAEYLPHLLQMLQEKRKSLEDRHQKAVPLLVKIAPDLSSAELVALVKTLLQEKVDGMIACNTTIDHASVAHCCHGEEQGGLSGEPLRERSLALLRETLTLVDGAFPIISVGGIMSPADALERLSEGAALIQLYSGLIYQGSGLVRDCLGVMKADATDC